VERREFLKTLALQAAAWSLGCVRREGEPGRARGAGAAARPRLPANADSGRWQGDDFESGHRLRDAAEALRAIAGAPPAPAVDVVVVGGGVSGLVAARALARAGRTVRILEHAPVLGGNARSARWGETEYAIGAAYFCAPDPGSELETLYREVGALDAAKAVGEGGAFLRDGLLRGLWDGALDAATAAQTRRVRDAWRAIFAERYPAIPWVDGATAWTRAEFEAADAKPFSVYLSEVDAPPLVRTFCEHYCWSSFGGAPSEISTYAALNFVTAEFGGVLAMPGGNAGVVRLLARAVEALGVEARTSALVVEVDASRPEVAALRGPAGPGAALERHPCRAVVIAAPRFVARQIVRDYPPERAALVDAMRWRAYVVANALVARRPTVDWYEAYRLEPLDPVECGWTDLILADHVASKKENYSVLTAYRALPYDTGRATLILPESYERFREIVSRDLARWLPAIGLDARDVVDMNLARWGHPLVLARPGQLASGSLETLSRPLERAVFAHQDRFGTPAIECAIQAGLDAAREAEALLA
jgi:hypothetical protein